MIKWNYFMIFFLPMILSFFFCSADDLTYFQNNDPDPEFKLFNILDDYPALRSAFNPIDQRRFNRLLSNSINNKLIETKDILFLTQDLFDDPDHPVTDSIAYIRSILYQIINQDLLDIDPLSSNNDLSEDYEGYASDFYRFCDLISDSDIALSEDLIPIIQKLISYIKDTYKGDELEDVISDLVSFLRSNEGYIWRDNENDLGEDMGKLIFQLNENMWLDKDDNLITNNLEIDDIGVKDTGIGNTAKGIEVLLSGLNQLLRNESFRQIFYDILRETGSLMTSSVNEKKLKDVMKEYIYNVENYLDNGGVEYEKDYGEYPNFNPYSANDEKVYSDANISNSLNGLMAGLQSILLRSDRENSIIYDKNGKAYFLDILAKNLRNMNFNPDDHNSCAAHIEEAVYDLMRFDTYGRDRVVESYNPNKVKAGDESYPISILDKILLLSVNSTTWGWKDADTDEITNNAILVNPNAKHGHGEWWGHFTLNDVFFAAGVNNLLGLDLYEMLFTEAIRDHVFRSMNYFNIDEKERYTFYYDQNYPVFGFFGGFHAGDYGIPQGGNPSGEAHYEELNTYTPYDGLGLGNNDLAGWLLGKVVRAIWMGEGPYYSREGMIQEGDIYTYYRPNGKIYVKIRKPDPDDVSTWEYMYVAEENDANRMFNDPPKAAQFISDVDLISDGGVILDESVVIGITIDGVDRKITFNSGLLNQNIVVAEINEVFYGVFDKNPCSPAGKGIMIIGENTIPPEGSIIIEDISGNGITQLLLQGGGVIKEFAGRENRYFERRLTDYYLISYRPFLSGEVYCNPVDMSGEATGPGCMVVKELIPEYSLDRECDTHEEAIFRNYNWFFAEWKIRIPLSLYINIGKNLITDLVNTIMCVMIDEEQCKDPSLWEWRNAPWGLEISYNLFMSLLQGILPDEMMSIPSFLVIEAIGANGLAQCQKVPYGNRYWMKKGIDGESNIIGDYRFDIRIAEKMLSSELQMALENLLGLLNYYFSTGLSTSLPQLFLDIIYDGLEIWGNRIIPPIFQDGRLVVPYIGKHLMPLAKLGFPRCQDVPDYGEESPSENYDDYMIGSRKGDQRKDENGVVQSAWGFEATNDDPIWRNRNAYMPLFVSILWTMREHNYYDYSQFSPFKPGASLTKNGIEYLVDGLFSFLVKPSHQYYEKDNPDCRYPHNTWKPYMYGGRLNNNHHLGERYYRQNDDGEPYSSYFLTRSFDVADRDPKSPYGGWGERNYYRRADVRNLLNIMIDSDPFASNPSRCDGLLPMLLYYDSSNFTNDPENKSNTRLLSHIFRLLYELADSQYDDPGTYDESDYRTWGARRKLCYSLEQIVTGIKVQREFVWAVNEINHKEMIRPDWMYSQDENGTPLPIRNNDILFEVAGFPDHMSIYDHNWGNFNRLMDALGELLSNNGETGGEYNTLENLISFIDKIFTRIDTNDDHIRGLRHTLGSAFTIFNRGEWEYPDQFAHLLERELSEILETFQGHYDNLFIIAEAIMLDYYDDRGFMEYFFRNLKSSYPTRDVYEQFYDFLGLDIVKRPDSALWSELAEILIDFAEMIEEDEQPGWIEEGHFYSNKYLLDNSNPFRAVGELLSW
ncbi:MAG: hypothetical protein SVZ03_09575 [Spirochaetota bacterium]|nr:hypothetical protein [Spirochaetota bacterium]